MQYDLTKVHEINLKILKEIDRICRKYKIKYMLDGGTLLGAVRHKGFIPWDDDADIAFTRNHYEAFLKVVRRELPDTMELLMPEDFRAVEWLAFASNAFNTMLPFYANVDTTPEYLSNTTGDVSTDNFYWSSRMIAAMADASYKKSVFHIERYQEHVLSKGHEIINRYDDMIQNEADTDKHLALKHEANQAVADMLKAATSDTLGKVLYELSNEMKNAYSRSDA